MTRKKLGRRRSSAVRCPAPCGKIRCYSEAEAWAVARMRYEELGGELAKRVYECSQSPGYWHMTRQETWTE